MIVASFLHKIAPFYSLGRWLLTFRLRRYLPPSDKLLRPHVSVTNPVSKKKAASQRAKVLASKTSSSEEKMAALKTIKTDTDSLDQSLGVPKSAHIQLQEKSLSWIDVDRLHYSGELEFLINFTLAVCITYLCTWVYYYLTPSAITSEYNLAVIWIVAVIMLTYKHLLSLTRVYLSEELSHQRSLFMVFTLLFFVFALIVMLIDESYLSFGLVKSHKDLCHSISVILGGLLKNQNVKVHRLLPLWLYKVVLTLLATMLSATMIFSGFRFADTHFSTIRYTKTPMFKTLLHANYIAPMFCLSLWIQPLTGTVTEDSDAATAMLGLHLRRDDIRVLVLVLVCLLRFGLLRTYLQTHLNSARWKMESQRSEPGRIAIYTLRRNVNNIFLFYAALGIQYLGPYIILLALTLLFNSSSLDCMKQHSGENPTGTVNSVLSKSGWGTGTFHGCFAFLCWWVCFTNAITSGFGSILKEYL